MKTTLCILFLFVNGLTYCQQFRLDSLIHYNASYANDSYVNTYSYITDRDFTIYQKTLKDGGVTDIWTTVYRDSLPMYSTCTFNSGEEIMKEYQYDDLRREIYSSINMNSAPRTIRKSYWKDTDHLTMYEELFLINQDTMKFELRNFLYDDQGRIITSISRSLDALGKEHRVNSMTEYEGDSLAVEEMNIYNEGKGWTNYITKTQYYPKIFYGDTICTTYCQWDVDTQTKESACCTKYEWGKSGTKDDLGYIAYRSGNIYGKIADYIPSDFGYMWRGYECKSEKGPDHWREDLKSRFKLTGVICVTLNEYGLPAVEEAFQNTGDLWYRIEYFYKEAKPDYYSERTALTPANCQIIHYLNPNSTYYDLLGKRVTGAIETQFLIEIGSGVKKRVLFVRE
jgi:hypothetical protein